ncbi:MAG: hypothetical protein OHK0044_33310 [Burkholderiaceae bacterium]
MRIELIAPLTHEGVAFAPGEVIEIDEERARWLIALAGARAAATAGSPVLDGTLDVAPAYHKSRRKGD